MVRLLCSETHRKSHEARANIAKTRRDERFGGFRYQREPAERYPSGAPTRSASQVDRRRAVRPRRTSIPAPESTARRARRGRSTHGPGGRSARVRARRSQQQEHRVFTRSRSVDRRRPLVSCRGEARRQVTSGIALGLRTSANEWSGRSERHERLTWRAANPCPRSRRRRRERPRRERDRASARRGWS